MAVGRRMYEAMAADLAQRIQRGQWQPGERLPAVREMEQHWPYSRVTIQKAISLLQDQGYVTISPRSGAFVRSAFVRDRIGILTGGLLPNGIRAPFTMLATELASAYLHRCGYNTRVYNDDARSPIGIPEELDEALQAGQLKGLLTIQSKFGYRHMLTQRWKAHAVPHVDIGTPHVGHRVYIDYIGYYRLAIDYALEQGHTRIGLVDRGSGMPGDQLKQAFPSRRVHVCIPPADLARDGSHEAWGFHLAQHLFQQGRMPRVLVIPESNVAKGVVQAAMARQVSIPRELEVFTLVNRGLDTFFPAPVCRFEVDVETMTATAGQLLIDVINQPHAPSRELLLLPEYAGSTDDAALPLGAAAQA